MGARTHTARTVPAVSAAELGLAGNVAGHVIDEPHLGREDRPVASDAQFDGLLAPVPAEGA